MRRKIAVFSSGWGGEYLEEVLAGIVDRAVPDDTDVFAFVNFTTRSTAYENNVSEVNLFKLPNISDFDGVILLANSFNCEEEIDYLTKSVKKYKIPTISIEYDIAGIPVVSTDNYSGMYDLASHIIKEHKAEKIIYIGGPADHLESNIRLQSLLDVAKENNIDIPKDNILYGDWGKTLIPGLVGDWLQEHDHIPDAIICANDIMAIACCEYLASIDLVVPKDIMVTGYDCISFARNFNPPITSVNHEWFSMGEIAYAKLNDLINGENIERIISLPTKLVIGGSCGCDRSEYTNTSKSTLGRALSEHMMDPIVLDSHFRHFYNVVKNTDNAEGLYNGFSYLMEGEHTIEGENFALYLDPEFFNMVENNTNLRVEGYSDTFQRICSLSDGKREPMGIVSRESALYDKARKAKEASYYLFVALSSGNRTLGFALLDGALNAANENQYYMWSRHIIQALEQVRSNITISNLYAKMYQLSVTDALTGAYNRAGCESIAYPMIIDYQKTGGSSVLMLVDVDKMKVINDHFGHANGDKALTIIASVLKSGLPDDFVVARFGGDEFFVAGKLKYADEDIDEIVDRLEERLKTTVENTGVEFSLTMSIGYSVVSPKDQTDIEKGIMVADSNMYERKKIHHSESGSM